MAKLIVYGADRAEAIDRARAAVAGFEVAGPKCNLPFFAELLDNAEFVSGDYDTGIVGRMRGSKGVIDMTAPSRSARSAPRDGLQNEEPVPTDAKVRLLDALSAHRRPADRGGLVRPPEGDPADGRRRRGVGAGHEGAGGPLLGAGAQHRARSGRSPPGSPRSRWWSRRSDTHNRRNVNRSTAESLDDIAALIDAAARAPAPRSR